MQGYFLADDQNDIGAFGVSSTDVQLGQRVASIEMGVMQYGQLRTVGAAAGASSLRTPSSRMR